MAISNAELFDPDFYYRWIDAQVIEKASWKDICSQINHLKSAIAYVRSAMVALHFDAIDESSQFLLNARISSESEEIRLAIIILECFRELKTSRLEEKVSSVDGQSNVLAILKECKSKLVRLKNRTMFGLEQEYLCLRYIANCYHKQRDEDQALTYAQEALLLSKTMRNTYLTRGIRAIIVNLLINAGRLAEANRENQIMLNDKNNKSLQKNIQFDAEIKFSFGYFDEAFEILENSEIPHAYKAQATDFYSLLIGRFNPSMVVEELGKYNQIAEGLKILAQIHEIYPSASNQNEVDVLCSKLLTRVNHNVEFPSSSEKSLNIFLKSKARVLQREYGSAELAISGYRSENVEHDIFDALISAMKLEISLSPTDLQYLSVEKSLSEVLTVLRAFRGYSFASMHGLSNFLNFWTPTASAFLSLDEFGNEFFPLGNEAILRTQSGLAFVHGVQIPNALAIERALVNLGITLRLHGIESPNLNANQRAQRDQLRVLRGNTHVWRAVISASLIVLGFLKLHCETGDFRYYAKAKSVFEQYGIFPEINSNYAISLRKSIHESFERFFLNKLTFTGLMDEVVKIRM
jgi:tetratricopeptide (TPR) repeat protein